ncbi:hypothetical protein M9H77_02174 [Catharanthus roseus]|uniref:Uncharacterized protein n=1 Tax=Catharanthus roseus TaxID=4058 RepID=A0ACC0C7N0_CATRO|nr:hypothetical protein M9H77_02174 [Catharanthus roseus]
MWYNAKLRNRLVVERAVHDLLESQVGILDHFQAMEWDSLVTMTGDYYPNLVREFYANIFFKFDPYKTDITTSFKKVGILGIPDEGHSIFYERASTSIFSDSNWVYSESLAIFGVKAQAVGKRVVKSNGLQGTWKVNCEKPLLPQTSSKRTLLKESITGGMKMKGGGT